MGKEPRRVLVTPWDDDEEPWHGSFHGFSTAYTCAAGNQPMAIPCALVEDDKGVVQVIALYGAGNQMQFVDQRVASETGEILAGEGYVAKG